MKTIDSELQRIVDHVSKRGHFESIIKCIYYALIQEDSSAIDVGAHKGLHTFRLAERIGENGQILSFEPMSDFARIIQTKAAKLYKEPNNIKVFNLAVSDSEGEIPFYRNDKYLGQSTIVLGHGKEFDSTLQQTIPTVTLDAFIDFEKIGRLDFIKCDAEGADFKVLRGAETLFELKKPLMIMEFDIANLENLGISYSEFFGYLEANNLLMYSIDGRPFTESRIQEGELPFCYEMVVVKKGSEKQQFVEDRMPSIVWNWIRHDEWH